MYLVIKLSLNLGLMLSTILKLCHVFSYKVMSLNLGLLLSTILKLCHAQQSNNPTAIK